MNKCVKILIIGAVSDDFLHDFIQKQARKLSIEGSVARSSTDNLKIIACGDKDNVDLFVDAVHKELFKLLIQNIEVEPFLKEKDYRGVFRIIE